MPRDGYKPGANRFPIELGRIFVATGSAARPNLQAILAQRHLPALDGLRAVAVAQVIMYHAGLPILGDLGVTAFFALSGFLITWLLLKELDATGRVSFKAFYLRRTLRIFPAYYVFLVVSFVWDWMNHQVWSGGLIAAALLYVMNYYNALTGITTGSIAHTWSLAVEEQFYLLWPLALVWLARGGLQRVRAGLTIAILAVLLWRSFLYLVVGTGSAYVYNAFDTRFDSLAIGCLLAAWGTAPGFLSLARATAGSALLPLLTVTGLWVSRYKTPEAYHYALGLSVDSALVGLLIVQLLQLTRSPLWSWLDSAPMRYLGRISYPLYLWHLLAVGLGNRLATGPGRVVLGSLIAIVVASGSYYLVEKPALRFKPRQPASHT